MQPGRASAAYINLWGKGQAYPRLGLPTNMTKPDRAPISARMQGWDNLLDYSAVVAPCVNFRPAACWDLLHFALLCNMPDT